MISENQQIELQGRSLNPELLLKHGCRTDVDRAGIEWLAVPYPREGKVVNHKYRTLGGKKLFRQDPDAVKCVWNEDCLRDPALKGQPVIFTEGELDAFAAIECGHLRVVSAPDGAPAKEIGGAEDGTKYEYLAMVRELLMDEPHTPVIIASDGDGPGVNLMHDVALRLGKPRCKFLLYPKSRDGKRRLKDLNEVKEEYGARGVNETIARAGWVHKPGVYKMSERPRKELPVPRSLHMGDAVEPLLRMRRGDFWVVTGVPGHGKSMLVDHLVCLQAVREGMRTCFASFEKEPETDHRRDLRKWHIGEQRGHSNDDKWTFNEVEAADDFIERGFRFVVPSDQDDATLEWLVEQFEAAVVQHACDILVIDPWNEIEHDRPNNMTLTEYVGYAIKRLKRLAKYLGVTVIVVAHPAKMKMQDELSLYAISDSAHWSNKCDVGMLVKRRKKEDGGGGEVEIPKIRTDEIGRVGECSFQVDMVTRHLAFYPPRGTL